MASPEWEDLSEFFDPDEFGTAGIVWRDGATVVQILGIFDDPTVTRSLGEFELDQPGPRFACREGDVAAVRRHDFLEVDGSTFEIIEAPERDGSGLAVLILAPLPEAFDAGL